MKPSKKKKSVERMARNAATGAREAIEKEEKCGGDGIKRGDWGS